ncbi:putative bifunctional diguanylate cyclase/phosphodiesterase [Kineococcus sp. SYSU DK006]|uniref:putative bifunctional diguanylate cyclase/phosphodiesterase n=1 Tax=Kineococcus sp. SYSU DK006 TaxID=3383127 RepID=UPI003D7CF3AD
MHHVTATVPAPVAAPVPAPRAPGARTAPLTAVLTVAAAAVLVLATVLGASAGAPWRTSAFALLLAVVVVAAECRPAGVRPGTRGDLLPVAWGFLVALTALGPLSLALLVRAVPSLVRDVRRGAPVPALLVRTATAVTGVLVCRLVLDEVLGTPLSAVPALDAPQQWPAVLLAGAAGLLAETLARAAARRVVGQGPHRRRLRAGTASGPLLTLAVVASAPVVAVSAEGGASLLLLVCVPLGVLVVNGALARHHERRALVDDLTGLPNRGALLRATARALRPTGRPGAGPGLLVVDLDHFKDVNDTLGHPVGDALLREVAERLLVRAPRDAVVARLGGDEFALLVADGTRAEALAAAVVGEMSRPLRVGDLQVLLPASIGVALAPEHGSTASALLQSADVALYQAKEVRGRACTYAGRREVHSVERLRLLGDLGRAVDRGELFVQYQPQVDPATSRLVGVEALVRWHHPDLGAVAPDRFIPLAEQSGLVGRITSLVLDVAVGDLARWRAEGFRPTLSVNLSARLLTDAELPSLVEQVLQRHGVHASALVLEVTETGIVSDPRRAGAVVRRLRALGCAVAVDDFGTGQCSLTYLTDLEVDELKIDRSFVTGMTTDRARGVIVRSTVQMGRDLGLRVVAEGVEDARTQQVLAALGCHVAQGTHVGAPVSAQRLLRRLRGEEPAAGGAPVPPAARAPLPLEG